MNKIFNTDKSVLSKLAFDNLIVYNRYSLSIDFSESSLVYEFLDSLEVRVSVSNVWFDDSEHVDGGRSEADEDGVVDLSETQQL